MLPYLPEPTEVVAVLTGDLIASTQLSVDEMGRTRALMDTWARQLRPKSARGVYGIPEFFRGDSWQLLVKDPRQALRLALALHARLLSEADVGTRICIGLGTAQHIDARRVSLSTGEAFTLSGRGLDDMTAHFDLTGVVPERAGVLVRWVPALLHLVSGLVRPWTRRQAQIVNLALLPEDLTHEGIAKRLVPPVTKQTVSESLAGAGWRPLLEAIRAFEGTDWQQVLAPR